VIGFDTFGGFPNLDEKDGPESSGVQKCIGGLSSASFRDEFEELLRLHNEDGVIPSSRGSIIVGDISDTLPAFLNENQETMFCLINLDVDIYEPTKLVLDLCWDRLVKGGVLILDEYATSKWPGETIAWNEFAQERGIMTKLQRFSFANAPGAYMIKE
jgi:3-O-methyltransferase